MKKHIIPMVLLIFSSVLVISSCKDEDEDPNNTGTFENSGLESNGSNVKATVNTFTSDNEAVSYEVSYERNYVYPFYEEGLVDNTVEATLASTVTSVASGTNYATVEISNLQSLGQQSPIPDITIEIHGTKEMSDGRTFRGGSTHSTPGMEITNYKYDASTRTITADFKDTTATGDNGEDVEVTGSFRLTNIKEYAQRPGKITKTIEVTK